MAPSIRKAIDSTLELPIYTGGDSGGAVAVRAPGFRDVFDAFSSTSSDTHGCRDRRPAEVSE